MLMARQRPLEAFSRGFRGRLAISPHFIFLGRVVGPCGCEFFFLAFFCFSFLLIPGIICYYLPLITQAPGEPSSIGLCV